MPAVPYKGYPEVEATSASTPALRVSTPSEAFGSGVAQAIGHLGKTIEGAGDELWKRAIALQEVRNKAEAEQAETQYMMDSSELHAEFNSLQGKAAVDAFPKYKEDLDRIRVGLKDQISNDHARRLYDGASNSIMGRHVFNGAGHAAAQNKRYVAGTSAARLEGIKDYVLHNPADVSAYEDGVRSIEQEVRGTQAAVAGWGPEQTNEEVKKGISGLTASRIIGLARTQPLQAKAMLEEYKDRLHGDDLLKVDNAVTTQTRTIGSRIIANQAGGGDSSIPLEKAVEEGERLANKQFPEDPTMADFVRRQIISQRNEQKSIKRERDLDNKEIIDDAMVGIKTKGKLPTSIEQLIEADPRIQQIWEQLPPKDQSRYLDQFARNAKDPVRATPETFKQVQILKGMAEEDPEKFLYTDIMSQDIPQADKAALMQLQRKKRKNIDADPRTLRALRDLAPMMNAAGIDKKKDEDQYFQFRASLQDMLDEFQKQHPGKTPTSKEVQEIGSRLIQEQKDPGKLLGDFFGRKSPTYLLTVPDTDKELIEGAFLADKGRKPTEEETRRIYRIKRYNELYGATPPSKPKVAQ